MFDAVIFSGADPEAAARTLSTLVEGVVENMVARVTVVSFEEGPDLAKLADAAGCRVLAGVERSKLREQLSAVLESTHLLALRAGALLPPGWPGLLRAEIAQRGMPGGGVALLFEPMLLKDRVKLIVTQTVKGRFPLDHGALVPRTALLEGGFDGQTIKVFGPVQMSRLKVMRVI
jgi:hypothetical protein